MNKAVVHIDVEHLETINRVRFTKREIDIIAYLVSGRGGKITASCLDMAPKTVEAHTHNIMLKLGCNSKEGVINFVEQSDKFLEIKNHYLKLLNETLFKQQLKKISLLTEKDAPVCFVTSLYPQENEVLCTQRLNKNLMLAGVNLFEYKNKHKSVVDLIRDLELQRIDKVFCMVSKESISQLQTGDTLDRIFQLVDKSNRLSRFVTFLILDKDSNISLPKQICDIGYIDFTTYNNYYFAVFEILKNVLRTANIDEIIKEFEQSYKKTTDELFDSIHNSLSKSYPQERGKSNTIRLVTKIIKIIAGHKSYVGLVFLLLFFLTFFALKYNGVITRISSQLDTVNSWKEEESCIRADLVVPTESFLLHRTELISQIGAKLDEQVGIKSIALVGTGGAGKTTLSRQYAHHQKANVIWEINAETKRSLYGSFEGLAQALAQTEQSKKALKEIQGIKNSIEKEREIIQFVRECLKFRSNWVLIFDNVEKFSDIQKYFPQDLKTWGYGKVILTTRDINIKNNAHINNSIQIEELDLHQKLTLFTKILNHESVRPLTPGQIREAEIFLEKIPSFPLDVSIAAYYLRATKESYAAYLENLTQYNEDFSSIQKNLLKEAGDYTKTRYGIIILSLEQIINTHKDFRDLLLFISFFDSQEIPRDLLDQCKTSTVVDNFIYTLRKYSLITNESPYSSSIATFSIHRSTQAIALAYLIKLLKLEKDKSFVERIGIIFKNYATEVIDKGNFLKMNLLIRHCKMFLSHTELLTDSVIASISCELGYINRDLGNYEKAKDLLEKSLVIYKKNSYENHPSCARALQFLGNVYRDLANYEKAKDLLEQSLVIYKKNSYENHPCFFWALGCLGNTYRYIGNYEKARDLLEQSVICYRKNSYDNHPWLAWSLACLGNVYRDLGDCKKAKDLVEQALAIHKKNSYENHSWFAWSLECLGNVYRDLGNYEKARDLLEQSILCYRKNSYDNHPLFSRALICLGNVYRNLGDYKKAKYLFEQSLIIYKKNSFENSSWFAWNLTCLGNVYRDLGNYEKAKDLFEQSIMIYKKNSFENHPSFSLVLQSLDNVYKDLPPNHKKLSQTKRLQL